MTFLAIALLMSLAAGLAVALPLWRARVVAPADSVTANRQVHAARLVELRQDLETGKLSQDAYADARRDLEADLTQAGAEQIDTAGGPRPLMAAAALLVVLGLAGALYWAYGSWRVGAEGVEAATRRSVLDMVDQLARHLQTPEGASDLQGWDTLGHSYMIMGRYPQALDAFQHARRLSNDADPRELAGYAEALTLTHPDAFGKEAAPLFEKVLQMDPGNAQALWYGGLAALQRGDRILAVQRWNAVLAQNPPAEYRRLIEQAIAAAGGTPAGAASSGAGIALHVSVAKELLTKLPGDSVVFIYAQPRKGVGGPPLAVRRVSLADLPLDLSLSDQDAVMPGRVLSSYDDVLVSARVSLHGSVQPQPGDLLGQVEWKKTASPKRLAVVIDSVVK